MNVPDSVSRDNSTIKHSVMQTLENFLALPWMDTVLGLVLLIFFSWFAYLIARRVLLRMVRAVTKRTVWKWDDTLEAHGVFDHLTRMVPTLAVQFGIVLVPDIPVNIDRLIGNVALALTVWFALLAISAALNALEDLYQATPQGKHRSIKGYVQLLKILLFLIGVIVIIASLINRSPLLLLSGLGAVSAVLLLIFKDTILSVVASVQLASNDMLRVGDWISMPEDNVDGDVVDVALHTIKVVNWDKTISTVPTWHLISHSFRNYRNMYETGRRIRRALYIDLTTVRFLAPDEIEHLRRFRLLDGYFERKEKELVAWNAELGEAGQLPINQRRLSNLGTFRAYVQAYILADPKVNTGLFWAVRQLDPGPTGIPLQIYAYTVDTGFVAHNNAQGDIFDHLIAILPEFGLALFQQPAGRDLANITFRGKQTGTGSPTSV